MDLLSPDYNTRSSRCRENIEHSLETSTENLHSSKCGLEHCRYSDNLVRFNGTSLASGCTHLLFASSRVDKNLPDDAVLCSMVAAIAYETAMASSSFCRYIVHPFLLCFCEDRNQNRKKNASWIPNRSNKELGMESQYLQLWSYRHRAYWINHMVHGLTTASSGWLKAPAEAERQLFNDLQIMTKKKDIWICILVPIVLSVMLFLSGETQWAIFSSALIPLFFICWGLSILLSGRRLREVEKHMTEEERKHLNELAKTYGKKVALFFAIPLAAAYFILSDIVGVKNYVYYILVFAVFFLIWLFFGFRHRGEMTRFALSTRYAKEKGWDKIIN